LGGKLRDLRNRKEMNYTQQDAKDIIDINTADENAAFMRLAEKLIQQQDAAVSNPAGIRASIPEQGRRLTFKRSVAVEPWADLNINLQASVTRTASVAIRMLILAAALSVFAIFGPGLRRYLARNPTEPGKRPIRNGKPPTRHSPLTARSTSRAMFPAEQGSRAGRI